MTPILNLIFLGRFTYLRVKFTTEVCLGSFKADFYRFREPFKDGYTPADGTWLEPQDYITEDKLSFWFTFLILYETVVTGVHLLTIIAQFYINILRERF